MNTGRGTKARSGSANRQRTDMVSVRLLPSETVALRALAQQHGHPSVQALIRDALRPLLAGREDRSEG